MLLIFIFSLVTILFIDLLPLKSLKIGNKSFKEYAEVLPFELKNLSKREQLLYDMLKCEDEKLFKIYLNKLKSKYLVVWTEEYGNGKKIGGIHMGNNYRKY
ncbi:hypothetical protein Calla_0998 [Caldicellulosiruptor acetigenus 6A]|uniref:Uncharacterized protein n=1 Tax=Caldicellulosiruptor acetigenus 6A TaxID=632516 RepID=G2PVC3_9FIRM|nr:hypothetical protein Calla_0998 [Caldicellulosiruptor acetigenus 6A]